MSDVITSPDCLRVAAKATVSMPTVARAYRGKNIHATNRERICRAAAELGLPPPPEPRAA